MGTNEGLTGSMKGDTMGILMETVMGPDPLHMIAMGWELVKGLAVPSLTWRLNSLGFLYFHS